MPITANFSSSRFAIIVVSSSCDDAVVDIDTTTIGAVLHSAVRLHLAPSSGGTEKRHCLAGLLRGTNKSTYCAIMTPQNYRLLKTVFCCSSSNKPIYTCISFSQITTYISSRLFMVSRALDKSLSKLFSLIVSSLFFGEVTVQLGSSRRGSARTISLLN